MLRTGFQSSCDGNGVTTKTTTTTTTTTRNSGSCARSNSYVCYLPPACCFGDSAVRVLLLYIVSSFRRMSAMSVEAVTSSAYHGEGPHWDDEEKVLYFVNILNKDVHKYDPVTKRETIAKIGDGTVSFIIPVQGQKNKFLISVGLKVCLLTWDGESEKPTKIEELASAEGPEEKGVQINDGKADVSGRLWTGTMGAINEFMFDETVGSLYSFSKTESLRKHVSEITCSNGISWTIDNKTMYYVDTATLKVDAFDFDVENAVLSNRRTVFDFAVNNITGAPDGMTIDTNGNLWVACFGGSQVIQIDPKLGKVLQTIPIPCRNVTSVAFGGDNLDELYVTTSSLFITPEEREKYPNAGCTFLVKGINAKGLAMFNAKL